MANELFQPQPVEFAMSMFEGAFQCVIEYQDLTAEAINSISSQGFVDSELLDEIAAHETKLDDYHEGLQKAIVAIELV